MRFRFTIRDLLWLTLVVALVAGWLVDRRSYSAPPRFQLFDKSGPSAASGIRTKYLIDNQTGQRWVKVDGPTGDTEMTMWYPTSIKKAPATSATGK